MEIKLTLALPRDSSSIPLIRRIMTESLRSLGTRRDCISDIEVAITEACTNVLKHAPSQAHYQVTSSIEGDVCVIEVVDTGAGFDASTEGRQDADVLAEGGRGIQLIRAMADSVTFQQDADDGTRVRLTKRLAFEPGSAFDRLASAEPPSAEPPSAALPSSELPSVQRRSAQGAGEAGRSEADQPTARSTTAG